MRSIRKTARSLRARPFFYRFPACRRLVQSEVNCKWYVWYWYAQTRSIKSMRVLIKKMIGSHTFLKLSAAEGKEWLIHINVLVDTSKEVWLKTISVTGCNIRNWAVFEEKNFSKQAYESACEISFSHTFLCGLTNENPSETRIVGKSSGWVVLVKWIVIPLSETYCIALLV